MATFLHVAADDAAHAEPAVFHEFVAGSIASADQALLTALLAPDDTGRTVFHAAASVGDDRAAQLLITSLQAPTLDADDVVPLLAAALGPDARTGKTLLATFAGNPAAFDALRPVIAALARSRWHDEHKHALWNALVGTQRLPRKAAAAVLELLSDAVGDLLPGSIRQTLEDWQAVTARVAEVEPPIRHPGDAQYLSDRHVDIDHVLHGSMNPEGHAVGGHASLKANSKRLRMRPGARITSHGNDTFTGFVDIKPPGAASWVEKIEPSTFFPPAWTSRRIRHEIATALRRGDAFASGEGPWDSPSDSGVRIRFYRDRNTGMVTCFPLAG
ncbi:EndoU domain-containing protein [Rhizobacter sp. Root1238]|uniref:EndoU domain-containing protein n=1 Tax=Rhizobacter sp. Root1238 TaxID=1736435 RepID=UPI00138F5702|nr:EndoU domain-containing protein [Rhizobacter sp. Root1238]